ncbi:MAG: NF038143 family protein [Deltaproteobacteria bacterium]|nr:NF038143 family protein [Deltaproteobacteria bacterium]
MANMRNIWQHEVRQADRVAAALTETSKVKSGWRTLLLPLFMADYFGHLGRKRRTRKNLLFTRQLAFDAAKNVQKTKEPAWEIRKYEIKTQEILDKEKKGLYTDKIRRKQLLEIEFLMNHYLDLFNTDGSSYQAVIIAKYPSRGRYQEFLNRLQKTEEEVIQAAIGTVRQGSKKERRLWYDKVRRMTKKFRMEEADRIYAEQ